MYDCVSVVSTKKKTLKSHMGQDQVSGGVSVLCWHAAPVAYVLWNVLAQLGKKSIMVIRSRPVMVKNWCNVLSVKGVTVCGHHPECRVTFGRGDLVLFGKIPVPTKELP